MKETFKNLNDGDIFIIISNDMDEKNPEKDYYRIFVLKLYQKTKGRVLGDNPENGPYIYESRCYLRESKEEKWKHAQYLSTSRPLCLPAGIILSQACGAGLSSIDYICFIVKDKEDILWNNAKNNLPFVDSDNLVDLEDIKLFMKQFTRDFVLDVCLESL
jgi:hypothetical protein